MSKQESINWIITLSENTVNVDTLWDLSAQEAEEIANRLFQKAKQACSE